MWGRRSVIALGKISEHERLPGGERQRIFYNGETYEIFQSGRWLEECVIYGITYFHGVILDGKGSVCISKQKERCSLLRRVLRRLDSCSLWIITLLTRLSLFHFKPNLLFLCVTLKLQWEQAALAFLQLFNELLNQDAWLLPVYLLMHTKLTNVNPGWSILPFSPCHLLVAGCACWRYLQADRAFFSGPGWSNWD